jgi:hypothetical protein
MHERLYNISSGLKKTTKKPTVSCSLESREEDLPEECHFSNFSSNTLQLLKWKHFKRDSEVCLKNNPNEKLIKRHE